MKRPARPVRMVTFSATIADDHAIIIAPLRIRSAANLREHWAAKARRVERERRDVATILRPHWREATLFSLDAGRLVVTLTRLAPCALDDDNNVGGFKAIRDEIARWLGIDDRDPRVVWRYGQRKSAACGAEIAFRKKE